MVKQVHLKAETDFAFDLPASVNHLVAERRLKPLTMLLDSTALSSIGGKLL